MTKKWSIMLILLTKEKEKKMQIGDNSEDNYEYGYMTNIKEYFMDSINIKKIIKFGVALILTITVTLNSCSVVQQRERGVKYVFGR